MLPSIIPVQSPLSNDAVTTVKILDANVTGAKIESNVALAGSPTTTTQTAADNSTKVATTAYADAAAAATQSLNDTANIFVGNGSNVATGVALSGDATIANTGALTIANDAVTTVKILDDANVTGAKIESSVALAGSPTTTTQTAADNSTKNCYDCLRRRCCCCDSISQPTQTSLLVTEAMLLLG